MGGIPPPHLTTTFFTIQSYPQFLFTFLGCYFKILKILVVFGVRQTAWLLGFRGLNATF